MSFSWLSVHQAKGNTQTLSESLGMGSELMVIPGDLQDHYYPSVRIECMGQVINET